MGEYEDRYPDAYRDSETPGGNPPAPPSQGMAPAPRQTREQPLRSAFGATAVAPENAAGAPPPETSWRHAPSQTNTAVGTAGDASGGTYRGRGPRGYIRSPARIYEDICDRLSDDPFVDASDIDVAVGTAGVVLAGSVETEDMSRRAAVTACEVSGVVHVQNRLTVRPARAGEIARPIDR